MQSWRRTLGQKGRCAPQLTTSSILLHLCVCLPIPGSCRQARPLGPPAAYLPWVRAQGSLDSVADADLVATTGNLTLPVGPALTGIAASETFAATAQSPAGAAAAAAPTTAAPGQSFTDCYSPTLYVLPDGTCALQPRTRPWIGPCLYQDMPDAKS